jgi:hypothetical protein
MSKTFDYQIMEKEFCNKRITFLGVGPMSNTVVDCVIQLATEAKLPVSLIPSRRQIESAELGSGYVNNWSTEDFTSYVRKKDHSNLVLLSRDHSGPWQQSKVNSNGEIMSHREAMEECKSSLAVDLDCGFDLIHLDPSQGLQFGRSQAEIEDDIIELLTFCISTGNSNLPIFEIGADEQSSKPEHVHEAEVSLQRVLKRIDKEHLPRPLFYVLQTGTKVMELRNVGSFDSKLPVNGMLPATVQVPSMLEMCRRNQIFLKEHNADYLSDRALDWHRRFGIHAANVAPEFGVCETQSLIEVAKSTGNDWFISEFGAHVLSKGRFDKWLIQGSKITDEEKIQIGGHYHFSEPEVTEMKAKLQSKLASLNIDLDLFVKAKVNNAIKRYMWNFGYNV